jgi:hypothetical protein
MPADDLVLNVRQIAGYPPVTSAPTSSTLLLQIAGLGSAYASISAADLVATALASGGAMSVGGQLSAQAFAGGSAQFSNAAVGMFSAQKACIVDLAANVGTIGGVPIATTLDVAATVTSFNMRTGPITLWLEDILCAGGAPIYSPRFSGNPRAATPCPESNSTRLATTAFVTTAIANLIAGESFVVSFNGRLGAVVLTAADVVAANPPYAPLDSPAFSGNATAPTAAVGTSDGQIATTAFVMNAVADSTTGVVSFNTRSGAVTLLPADITGAGGAVLASPVFTGTPQGPTAVVGTNSTQLATTAFVQAAGAAAGYAPLASPAFTGIPTAPTAAVGVSTTQLATTAFVQAAIAAISAGVVSFNGRTGVVSLIANDISAAGGAVLASPAFTGTPTAPTASVGTNTTQLATTAFVAAAGYAPLNSPAFSGSPTAPTAAPGVSTTQLATTAYVMAAIGASGYAPLNSPALTGVPTAPTAVTGTSTTQIATTAFVAAAIAAGVAGVSTFNGRAGAVTLIANDLSAAGGALLASPAFAGVPTAPTATPGTNTTQLATTAFVMAALPAASPAPPLMNGAAAVGTSAAWSRGDHVHPTDTSRAAQASLANYLPLTGGTLSGALTGTTATFTSGACNVTSGVGQPSFNIQSSGVNAAEFYYNVTSGICGLYHLTSGQTAGMLNDGTFNITGGQAWKPGGGPWGTPSDARIKTVEGDYAQGLDEVLQLRPVAFTYKGNQTSHAGEPSPMAKVAADATKFVGLIAQEVEPIFPGMVSRQRGFIDGVAVDDLRVLDTNELVFALVNAVKTLAARVATLEAAA